MTCSPARLAANQANSLRSTGPRTEEGKLASRGNALKHGLSGAGVALPSEDAAEVARRFEVMQTELAPEGEMARALVGRIALLSIRLERCVLHDSAALSGRVRSAVADHEEARIAEVDRLMAEIDSEPATVVRQLRRMPEGVDRMIALWLALRADVSCVVENRWTGVHRHLAENLTGRRVGDIGTSRVEALARAVSGDFTHLTPAEGAGLDDRSRKSWAREQMAGWIDAEVDRLRAHRLTLDFEGIAADRAEAASLVLFDASPQARLAHRYEAEAERGLYRALRELRELSGKKAAPRTEVVEPTPGQSTAELLASFRAATAAASAAELLTPRTGLNRRPDPIRNRPLPPSQRGQGGQTTPRNASEIAVGLG